MGGENSGEDKNLKITPEYWKEAVNMSEIYHQSMTDG